MSRRTTTGILFIIALGFAAYALFRVERRHEARPALAAGSLSVRNTAGAPAEPRNTAAPITATHRPEKEKAPPDPGETTLPLRPGEVLEFIANVSKLSNVANLRFEVRERKDFLGKTVWHLQAFARTENPLRMVFALDDQFDSYSDASTLASLQYELPLNERGEKVESIQRMTTSGKEPASPGIVRAHVLPGTRDPLGLMQYLRTVDWSRTPEVRSPVYDGHKLYDVHARVEGTESVTVPAGTYDTSKIAIHVFDNGAEMKDASFSLYLASDAVRTPVLLEAVLPFATARVELSKAQ